MMSAAAVLRSQDCLRKPYVTRRNSPFNPNPYTNMKVSRSLHRKRSPTGFETNVQGGSRVRNPDRNKSPTSLAKNLVMGQVKILRRGEPLPDSKSSKQASAKTLKKKLGFGGRRDEDDLILCSTGRLGPEPETVQKQIRASDFYVGSCPIVASPPPSSLPVPAFFSKKEKKIDEATSDLLRLLRLDLQ